ncbi:MAG: N-acetylmuramoyl-L-alanine amidase [Flavobacterium sp.]|nr:N-acetylmuramoyl-L-alanine amidase [Flavobacterium sp.]
METKYGFTKMTIPEFENWMSSLRIGRTILKIQQHHTYIPSYIHFTGNNHFERQLAMKNHHVNQNGWRDIGQHFTIFPDGTVMTGRSLELSPACITNQNANSICIENFGNFDLNGDVMTTSQKDAIVAVTAALCKKFNLAVNANTIIYHHWFRLDNGVRNNGAGGNKSCPGTNFFGGNKVIDFDNHFAPLVSAKLNGHSIKTDTTSILKYVCVTASVLNIRIAPKASSAKAKERSSIEMGAVLRVYEERDNWYKISNSLEHWVAGRYTDEVKRATVNTTVLNVRTGPGTNFPKASSVLKDEEIFVHEENNGWCKIGLDDKWVSKSYLTF